LIWIKRAREHALWSPASDAEKLAGESRLRQDAASRRGGLE